MSYPNTINNPPQANWAPVAVENWEALGAAAMYAQNYATTTALTLGFFGGHIASSVIADGTVALTNAATNYVVAHRTTGAVTAATNTTNWDATSTYGRLFKATTAGSVITALEDWREQAGGWFDRAAAGGATASVVTITDAGGYYTGTEVETALQEIGAALQSAGKVPAQRYTIELANTTDSDPGAGLIKFNNATPASATELYIDDSTSDSVDLSTLFASFGTSGFIKIQSVADAGEWAIFKWTATTDQTGYWKFAVTPQASKGTLDDADAVLIEFDSGGVVASDALWDAKGDLAGGTGANAAAKLTVGANDTMLMAASGETTGLKWATPTEVATAVQGTGGSSASVGFRGLPVNSQSGNYTTVLSDVGKSVRHPSGGGAGDTFTIDSQANVTWPDGAAITFENRDSNSLSIAITTDTLRWASTGGTGTRTLAQYGIATAVFDDAINEWLISGTGLA